MECKTTLAGWGRGRCYGQTQVGIFCLAGGNPAADVLIGTEALLPQYL